MEPGKCQILAMRILHVLSQTELTGAEAYAAELIRNQLQMGHEVHVISDKFHLKIPIELYSLPISSKVAATRAATANKIRHFLIQNQIEVIHAHSRASVRLAHRARKKLSIGLVSTIHGRQHSSFGKRFLDIYGEYKIAICENLRPQLERDFRIDPSSIKTIRNPFRVEDYELQPDPGLRFRMGFVGRSSGPKGERFKELFYRHIDPILRKQTQWNFDIVVSHPDQLGEKFFEFVMTAPYKSRVRIFPPILDPYSFRSLLPNYDLVFAAGRVAVESLLMGVPVFAIGEFCSIGVVNHSNLERCLESNFGDIGIEGPLESELPSAVPALIAGLEQGWRKDIDQVADIVRGAYDGKSIQNEILEVYRAARFRRAVPRCIPILMYHRVPDSKIESQHQTYVTKNSFVSHLQFLRTMGFQSLTFSDLADFWHGRRDLSTFPKRPIVLTFDDGYRDNLTNALPILKEFGFRAVIYLLGDNSLDRNNWDGPSERSMLMSKEERQELVRSGVFEVGSHAYDHIDLSKLTAEEASQQLRKSKAALEQEFGAPIISVAYPFGKTNGKVIEIAKDSGYEFAVGTDSGGVHLADDRWNVFRTNIFPRDGRFSLWKKSSPWYRRRFLRKHGR